MIFWSNLCKFQVVSNLAVLQERSMHTLQPILQKIIQIVLRYALKIIRDFRV